MAPFTGYVLALLWGILPLLWFTALRRYLQAVNIGQTGEPSRW